MVEKDEVSKDFRKQVLGCGLTIAESYDDYAILPRACNSCGSRQS